MLGSRIPCLFEAHFVTTAARRAALAALAALLPACSVEIQHQLTEKEANEILVVLERRGIATQKVKEEGGREPTWAIAVSKANAAAAAMLLRENELPRPRSPGFEIFNRGSLIPTATEERAMFLQALAGELSRTLSSVEGVLDARVHVNIPQNDDLSDRSVRPEPTASVLLKYRVLPDAAKKGAPISEEQVQALVSRAVQDLKPTSVSVVMTPAAVPSPEQAAQTAEVDVLPGVRIAAESLGAFRLYLAGMGICVLGLAGAIAFRKVREMGGGRRVHPEA